MSETVERLRRCELDGEMGPSAERVLVVSNEREAREEIEEEGVWVLFDGGGVVNESCLRSGSNGEIEGVREGAWTFMGKVKARGVGDITLNVGEIVVSGPATATSRAWV